MILKKKRQASLSATKIACAFKIVTMKNMKRYPISLEVASTFGSFARPDSGSDAISYTVPTYGAIQGIIHSVLSNKKLNWSIEVHPVAVALCNPPDFYANSYTSNSPMRKIDTIKDGNACVINQTILHEPKFQILALVCNRQNRNHEMNYAHSYQDRFNRTLKTGRFNNTVSMGEKHMICSYVGKMISNVLDSYNEFIPTMVGLSLTEPFDLVNCRIEKINSLYRVIQKNIWIKNGILNFTNNSVSLKNGKLSFDDKEMQLQVENAQTRGWPRKAKS